MRVKGIRHICLTVKDMPKMVEFYQNLGFSKTVWNKIENGEYLSATMGLANASAYIVKLQADDDSLLELLQLYSHSDEDRSHIGITVDNLEEGIKSPYSNVKTKFIQDPEGNWLELVEEL